MSITIKKEPNYEPLSTLVQVKEQDTKDVKVVIHQLQDVAGELAERPDIDIKQEPTTKVEDELQNARLNQDVYYYYCNLCGEKMMDLRSTVLHKQEVHNTHQRSRYKHMDMEPDIDDPKSYCATCEKSFSTKASFEYHLKTLHFIVRVRATLVPEIDDPSFYCRQCDFTYMNQKFYFKHLKSYHGMKPRSSPSSSFNSTANAPKIIKKQHKKSRICCRTCGAKFSSKKNYAYHTALVHSISRKKQVDANMVTIPSYEELYQCRSCSSNFDSKKMYLEHLHSIHAMNINEGSKTPDVNDPNFYCQVCDFTSTSYENFKIHLFAVHRIGTSSSSSASIKVEYEDTRPDPDDSNFYCRICQHNFFFKDSYKKHLLLVHHHGLASDSSSLPDPSDPNFYCSVCQKSWKTSQKYRQHCKVTHKMELGPQRRSFYNATIDPSDPKSYCAQCNRTYMNYRQHLKTAHNISAPPPPPPPPLQ